MSSSFVGTTQALMRESARLILGPCCALASSSSAMPSQADIAQIAARTGAGAVLLTHLQMRHDPEATIASVRDHYDGPVTLVTPGFSTEIGQGG